VGINEEKARLLLGGIFTARLPRDLDDFDLERFPIGNYIVFRDALQASFEDTKTRLNQFKRKLRERGIEPLFMMDEEGGRVTQIAGFFPSAPSAGAVSRHLKPEEAGMLYRYMSAALADLGIDVNLAPCVDVNTEPVNPIIGCRAFGSEVGAVEHYGGAFIGSAKPHTACVAKHFPGHGMTKVDSHLDMPLVGTPREQLEAVHIRAFRDAIRAGADGIMMSHCHYDALEAELIPASLSKVVVGHILRKDLGFDRLVLTDSLDMDAVTANRGPVESSRAAIDAGVDILLYTENSTRFEDAFEAMTADLVSGKLKQARIMKSIARRKVLLGMPSTRTPAPPGITHQRYLELRERVMARSLHAEDPRGLLPIMASEAGLVTSDPRLFEKTPPDRRVLREISSAEEASGRLLVLWLMEPLRLKVSLATIRRMIDAAQASVLVTSYTHLAEAFPACDARVVVEDTSPETQAAILSRILDTGP